MKGSEIVVKRGDKESQRVTLPADAKPRAPFTLVMGHHPLYSNGDHGDTTALVEEWEPLSVCC